jgi:alpha-tubulin suppressor-like RCC1 family protein
MARHTHIRLHLGTVALALVAVVASLAAVVSPVGAVFTTDASVDEQSVKAAIIADLAGGAASRTPDGEATVSWTTPELADAADYGIVRAVGGVETAVDPALAVSGATSFTDDLTVAPTVAPTPFTEVVAGYAHSCGVAAGTVYCWGDNSRGQLGHASTRVDFTPVPAAVTGIDSDVIDLAAGQYHTCAVTAAGDTWCWGANESGQLGDGTTAQSGTPVRTVLAEATTAISAGSGFTCAVVTDGGVRCWGTNYYGQLGRAAAVGTATPSPWPTRVDGLEGSARTLTTGANHTCAILDDGSASCWGNNYHGQLGSPAGAGSLYGSTIPTPTAVQGLAAEVTQLVASNGNHTCAVLSDETTSCWGRNDYGQLGNASGLGEQSPHAVPTTVQGLSSPVTSLATGTSHTCAVLADASMRCWGWNYFGQLGSTRVVGGLEGWPTPDPTGPFFAAATVAAGSSHTCAIGEDGAPRCWGWNRYGQMGRGVPQDTNWPWTAVSNAQVPPSATCADGWTLTRDDRCAPGDSIPVSYEIAYSVHGWTPPSALVLDAPFADPTPQAAVSFGVTKFGNFSAEVTVTNPDDETRHIVLAFAGELANGAALTSFGYSGWTAAWDATGYELSRTFAPGESFSGLTISIGPRGQGISSVLPLTFRTEGLPTVTHEFPFELL